MKTQQQRAEERRRQKLAEVQQQVDDGTLVIRKMTPAEREKFAAPKRPRKAKRR